MSAARSYSLQLSSVLALLAHLALFWLAHSILIGPFLNAMKGNIEH